MQESVSAITFFLGRNKAKLLCIKFKIKILKMSLKSVICFYTSYSLVPVFSLHASDGYRLYSDFVHLGL